MGKRICKSWSLPGGCWIAGAFLGLCFIGGGLLGCLFFRVCGESGGQALAAYLRDYLQLSLNAGVSQGFWAAFWSESRYGLMALLLWWTSFGVVGYPFIFALRGFLLSFSVGAFIRVFGLSGALPGFVMFLLPALCWGPALFLLSIRGFSRVGRTLSHVEGTFAGLGSAELRTLGLAFVLFFLCGVLECFVLPQILPFAAKAVL